jgi:UDP-glucuronate decarboxylase
MVRLMETGPDFPGPVNVGNPGEFTMRELAEMAIRLTGSRSELVFMPIPADDPRQRRPDIELAREKLGWAPTIDLEAGMTRTIAYFRNLLAA